MNEYVDTGIDRSYVDTEPVQSYDDIIFDVRSLNRVLGSVTTRDFRIKYGLRKSPFFYSVRNIDDGYEMELGDLDGPQEIFTFASLEDLENDLLFHVVYYASKIYEDERNIRLIEMGKFNTNDFIAEYLS